MKITLGTLVASQPALDELGAVKGLPLKASYWLGRLMKKASSELQHYNDARIKALVELGATLTEGKREYDFPSPSAKADFITQHAELIATEVELPGDGFKIEQLGDVAISPVSMMALDWLITE